MSDRRSWSEAAYVGLAIVVGVSFVGFAVGTSETERLQTPLRDIAEHPAPSGELRPARSYLDMRTDPATQTALWESDRQRFAAALPSLEDPVVLDGSKPAALAARASRRAYDGAPPTVPHSVRQGSASECLACHEEGLRIGARTASVLSHDAYTSCTQCHVVEEAPMVASTWLEGGPWAVDNSFKGMESAGDGPRANALAPPTIPHHTLMRERCDSCHGVAGSDPIRTSHPYRQNCEQCHAPAALLELRPGVEI